MSQKTVIKLAEALLRRKELQAKVTQLQAINHNQLFEVRHIRKAIGDNIDDITSHIPKLTASQFTAEYDHYAKQLRLIDACIQKTNWEADVSVDNQVMQNYPEKTSQT